MTTLSTQTTVVVGTSYSLNSKREVDTKRHLSMHALYMSSCSGCLSFSNRAIATGRQLGLTTRLPRKDEDILSNILPMDTIELAVNLNVSTAKQALKQLHHRTGIKRSDNSTWPMVMMNAI